MKDVTPEALALSMRVYFSSYHLWAARRFVALAREVESRPDGTVPRFDIEQRAYVTNAILSAVAFMEAAINETIKDVVDQHEPYISPIPAGARTLIQAFWELTEQKNRSSLSILDKYQIVLAFCGKERFQTSKLPYQDADLVIKLRNELMHYKPETFGGEAAHKFLKLLSSKFLWNPLLNGSGNPYFPDHCLGSPCAAWVVASTTAFADEFFRTVAISPNYMRSKAWPSPW